MGIEEVERIKKLLSEAKVEFECFEHEPVRTSEDAARVRNAPLKTGIKAIVVKQRENKIYYVADVPANRKVDLKKMAKALKVKSFTLATPEEVLQETGCEVGGVPPLGYKKKIQVIVDNAVFENELNEFNAGMTTISIRLKSSDLKKVFENIKATICEVAK